MGVIGAAGLALCLGAAAAGCAEQPPPREALTADPPLVNSGSTAEDGAIQTELQRGIAYVKAEKFAEAVEHFKKAVEIKPTAEALTYLGVAEERTGKRAEAEADYKKALAADPAFVEAAQNLSALYLDDPPRPDDAIAVLSAAIGKGGDNPRLLQNLGYAKGLKGDVEGAGAAYKAALAKGEDAQVRFAFGALLLEKKRPDEAAPHLKKALEGTKDDAPLLVTLGRMLAGAKAYGDCVQAFDRALKLSSKDPEWFVRRGTCKHELGDEPGAKADYEAAIKVDEKFAAAHYYLGLSGLALKDRLLATKELEKAMKLGGDSPIGKNAKAKFEEIAKGNRKHK